MFVAFALGASETYQRRDRILNLFRAHTNVSQVNLPPEVRQFIRNSAPVASRQEVYQLDPSPPQTTVDNIIRTVWTETRSCVSSDTLDGSVLLLNQDSPAVQRGLRSLAHTTAAFGQGLNRLGQAAVNTAQAVQSVMNSVSNVEAATEAVAEEMGIEGEDLPDWVEVEEYVRHKEEGRRYQIVSIGRRKVTIEGYPPDFDGVGKITESHLRSEIVDLFEPCVDPNPYESRWDMLE